MGVGGGKVIPMPSPSINQNLVQNALKNALEKITNEIMQLYATFKESKEHIVGEKIIDVNRVDTKYCYAIDVVIRMYPEIRVGLRVVCELDFEIHDNDMIDLTDIKSRKEKLISQLRKRLAD
jgi:hypothetical protein